MAAKISEGKSRPVRALLCNEFFYPDRVGGTPTATANIARTLADDAGFDVSVITTVHGYRDSSLRYAKSENWDGVKIYRVNSPNWLRASTAKRLAGNVLYAYYAAFRALTLPRPDVVIVTTAPLTLPITANLLRRLRGVPYVYVIYDLDPDRTVALGLQGPDSRSVRMLRSYQEKWLKRSGKVIAIGRCMRDLLVSKYGLSADQVAVAEVGADPNVIRPLPTDTKFRRENNLPEFVALYSGNFGKYHDFDLILGAAERLQSDPRTAFVLVGGGQKEAYLREEIAKRGLKNVRLMEFVPEEDLADLLASASVHFVTMEEGMEGLCVPSKFYSCLASGRPVIAIMNRNTEVALTLDEEQCGISVKPGDLDALVVALETLRDQPELREQQGVRAREAFDRRFTVQQTVKRIREAIAGAVR